MSLLHSRSNFDSHEPYTPRSARPIGPFTIGRTPRPQTMTSLPENTPGPREVPQTIEYRHCRSTLGAIENKTLLDAIKLLPKYRDSESWHRFRNRYLQLIKMYDLQDVYEERYNPDLIVDPAQRQKYDRDAAFCLLLLQNCCEGKKANLTDNATSAKQLMLKLEAKEEPGTVATIAKMLDDCQATVMEDSEESVEQILQDVNTKFDRLEEVLRRLNVPLVQILRHSQLIGCLHPSYQSIQEAVAGMDIWDTTILTNTLVELTTQRSRNTAWKQVTTRRKIKEEKTEVKAARAVIKCEHCGGRNHSADQCWTKYPELKKKKKSRSPK